MNLGANIAIFYAFFVASGLFIYLIIQKILGDTLI